MKFEKFVAEEVIKNKKNNKRKKEEKSTNMKLNYNNKTNKSYY